MHTQYPFKSITFIRHAQSEQNIANRNKEVYAKDRLYGGLFDAPLTKVGKIQARNLGVEYDIGQHDICFTSALSRAIDTARIAFNGQANFYITPLINERSFGDFAGKRISDLEQNPTYYPYFHDELLRQHTAHWTICPPGGEALKQLHERCHYLFNSGLNELVGRQRHPLFVTHGLFMRSLLYYFGIVTYEEYFKYDVPNCQIIRLEKDIETMGWKLVNELPRNHRYRGGPWR